MLARKKERVGRGLTVSNRMFYKELKEGACKIVDVNMMILLA